MVCNDLSLRCGIHREWRIQLRFFSGDLSLQCGIGLSGWTNFNSQLRSESITNTDYSFFK